MKITQEDYSTLLEELSASMSLPDYDPKTEVTAAELARANNITFQTARKRLEASGLETHYVRMPDGKRAKAYRKK